MNNENYQLDLERRLLKLESDLQFTTRALSQESEEVKAIESSLAELRTIITTLSAKVIQSNETLSKLEANPFLAFTATLDLKKTVVIIVVITSIVSSLTNLTSLPDSKDQLILKKLEELLDDS